MNEWMNEWKDSDLSHALSDKLPTENTGLKHNATASHIIIIIIIIVAQSKWTVASLRDPCMAISDLHSVDSGRALASAWTLLSQTLRGRPDGLLQLAIGILPSYVSITGVGGVADKPFHTCATRSNLVAYTHK